MDVSKKEKEGRPYINHKLLSAHLTLKRAAIRTANKGPVRIHYKGLVPN
jgi:hypothetical protein